MCEEVIFCPSRRGGVYPRPCIGCEACFHGCPYQAREMAEDASPGENIRIKVNGVEFEVPEGITVKRALEMAGYSFGVFPAEGDLRAPCGLGGCYTCTVMAGGGFVRACVSPVREEMEIRTDLPEDYTPRRVMHGPQPRPQCQNFTTTYDGRTTPMSPEEAGRAVPRASLRFGVDRMAISGGEPTLNRP